MICTTGQPCFTCQVAGVRACPFKGGPDPLPLVAHEKPRRPKIVWIPPGVSLEQAERILDRFYGPRT